MNLKSVYHKVKSVFPFTEIDGRTKNIRWVFDWHEINPPEDVVEYDKMEILDESINITTKIKFESDNGDYCFVYTDSNFNINSMCLKVEL